MIQKLKDAGNMLIYFKVLQAHQTIIQTMVVVLGDELHVVVADADGLITGFDTDTAGNRTRAVIETFGNHV